MRLDNGSRAILKIGIPHPEARYESNALQFYDGNGAIRVFRSSADGFALLLEECIPGTDLWLLGVDGGDSVAAAILQNLWREPPSNLTFDTLTGYVNRWTVDRERITTKGGFDAKLVAEAVSLAQMLVDSQPTKVLLHGDFHPGNVLAAQRKPWLVIDPKPVVGEPAYDLAQWLLNRYGAAAQTADPVAVLRDQIARFAQRLDLDPTRIAGWTFAKAFGWGSEPAALNTFHEVARCFDALDE